MDVKEIILKRRAYRALEKEVISDKILRELSSLASLSPSCFNNQPWRFIFVRDPEKLKELQATLSKGNEWAERASLIIAVFSHVELDCVVHDREYYLFDTGMATAFLILRATELGLVCHPIAGFNDTMAKKTLNIPQEMALITLLIVGKHSKNPERVLSEKQLTSELERPERKPLEDIMKINSY